MKQRLMNDSAAYLESESQEAAAAASGLQRAE